MSQRNDTAATLLTLTALGGLLMWLAFSRWAEALGADPGVLFECALRGTAVLILIALVGSYIHARFTTSLAAAATLVWITAAIPLLRNIGHNAASQLQSRFDPQDLTPWWDHWALYGVVTVALLGLWWWAADRR